MADKPFRLERVITLPAGSLLQYGNGSRESFYFHDTDHNRTLDSADKKVVEKHLEKNQFEFESQKISKADLRRFGEEANAALVQARRERDELRSFLPSASAGQCFAPSSNGTAVAQSGDEFLFRPSLSLRTGRADPEKIYSLIDLMNWPKKKALNPARCFMARGLVPRDEIAGSAISSKEIEIVSGDLLAPLILKALGLDNDERLEASYSILRGAKRVHMDLTPAKPK